MARTKNTLSDINEYLFAALDAITNDDLTDEELDREMKRAGAVAKLSETIIRNGELALKTLQHLDTREGTSFGGGAVVIPGMLEYSGAPDEETPRLASGGGGVNRESIYTGDGGIYPATGERTLVCGIN